MVSSQATSSASLMRTLLVTAWAAAFERLRSVLGRSRVDAAGSKTLSSPSSKKSASSGQGHHKQRSKKGGKKMSSSPPPHPPASLSREATVSITPPVSPPRRSRPAAADAPRNSTNPPSVAVAAAAAAKTVVAVAAAVVESVGKHVGAKEAAISPKTTTTSSVDAVAGSALPATEEEAAGERPLDTSDTSAGCGGVVGAGDGAASNATADAVAPAVSVPTTVAVTAPAAVSGTAATAVELAAEMTAGVPFPDLMTAEQVKAMVEEDERAWEQARLSEKLQSKANAAAATGRPQLPRSSSSGSGASRKAEAGELDAAAIGGIVNDGWSEVGGGGSRARSGGAGGDGARGRVLSMRNVRAVARASRPSSPGSDPATTTSASSSECSEGSKDKPRHRRSVNGRGGGGGRGSGGAGGRVTIGTGKGVVPLAGNKSTWGGVPASHGSASNASGGSGGGSGGGGAGRAHTTRPPQGRGAASRAPTRDTEQAHTRTSRASYAPWTTPSPQALRVTGKPQPPSAASAVSASPSAKVKGGSPPGVDSDLAKATAPAKLPLRADRSHVNVLRQPLRAKAPVAGGVGKVAEVKRVEEGDTGAVSKMLPAVVMEMAAAPAPVAWTNTLSHPLGMKAEPAPLPPASEPPRPPPQHQQHWQRQQQREKQQRQQQQQHQLQQHQQHQQQHFFHQQEPHLLPMSAAPVHQHQHHHHHVGGHNYPPLSLPPHHHQHHNRQHHRPPPPPPPPPQFLPLPPSDATFATPSATAAAHPPPMVYTAQAHPAPLPTSSPTVSPRGGNGDGVCDVSGNDTGSAGGGPTAETSHYHVVEGAYDESPGMPGAGGDGGSGGGQFSPDANAVVPPPQIVVLPSPQEQQQQQQGPFSPLAMLPSEDSGAGGASAVFGQGPPVGYFPTTGLVGGGAGGGSGDAVGEAFEALVGALCWQVEYYFSADNLVNDAYLRGLMDSDGFVAVSKVCDCASMLPAYLQ